MFATVMNHPATDSDTPIKKLVIRPTHRSDGAQIRQNRTYHGSKRGRKIENEPPLVIKVLKNPNRKMKPISLNHPKKYDSNIHILPTRYNSIYYATAKVNGSFRNSPIRAYNATIERNEKNLH